MIHIIDCVDLTVRTRHSLTHDGIVATPPLNGLSKCIITDSEFSRSMTMSTLSSQCCRTIALGSRFELLMIPPCGCICINSTFRLASRASDGLAGYTKSTTKMERSIALHATRRLLLLSYTKAPGLLTSRPAVAYVSINLTLEHSSCTYNMCYKVLKVTDKCENHHVLSRQAC